jgi:hypothetical protein
VAEKVRKLISLAMAFILVCLVAEGFLQFHVFTPQVVLAATSNVTYYFNAHDVTDVWKTNPDNMTDGLNNSNTCLGEDLGAVANVTLRAYGWQDGGDEVLYLRPVFGGTIDGADYPTGGWTPPTDEASVAWSPYQNITNDANAPATWSWSDVQELDVDVVFVAAGAAKTMYIAKVEIVVTYTPPIEGSVSQGITIADQVTTVAGKAESVSQDITIADQATATIVKAGSVSQGITITDQVTATFAKGRCVSENVTITDGVTTAFARKRSITQDITLTDEVTATMARVKDVTQDITITDEVTATVVKEGAVSQDITVADEVTATVERVKDISQTLSLTATTSAETSFGRPVTQDITITDQVTAAAGGRNHIR